MGGQSVINSFANVILVVIVSLYWFSPYLNSSELRQQASKETASSILPIG